MVSSRPVWFLVDYGNLHDLDSKRGIRFLVSLFLERLGEDRLKHTSRANIRLYGGWYEEDSLTRLAQNILAEIDTGFPSIVQTMGSKVLVAVELARSLIASPKHDLLHTYRARQFSGNITCTEPPFSGCMNNEHCPIYAVSKFVNGKKCISEGCRVRPKQIFSRPTQKLVDSMIVADVISLSFRGHECAVVSSDDDIWPGIRTAVEYGHPIYHLHCKPNRSTPAHYTEGVTENYIQIMY